MYSVLLLWTVAAQAADWRATVAAPLIAKSWIEVGNDTTEALMVGFGTSSSQVGTFGELTTGPELGVGCLVADHSELRLRLGAATASYEDEQYDQEGTLKGTDIAGGYTHHFPLDKGGLTLGAALRRTHRSYEESGPDLSVTILMAEAEFWYLYSFTQKVSFDVGVRAGKSLNVTTKYGGDEQNEEMDISSMGALGGLSVWF